MLWRQIEPGTPPPQKRLQVMRRLREAGVPCGVFLAPVLPGITDSTVSIAAVAAAAAEHGAVSFGSSSLRLAPLVKEHYLSFIAAKFPDLIARYERAFAGTNAPAAYQAEVERRVAHICGHYGFAEDSMRTRRAETVAPGGRGGQLSLPL